MTGDTQTGATQRDAAQHDVVQHDATAEFNEALAASFAAADFDAIGPFYTEDASLLPPRGKSLEGRAAASAFWSTVANRFTSATFTTAGLKNLGDAARRETGTYAMAGEGHSVEGKYVFVWQLVEGEWQIESAIWNRNGEAGGGQRQGRNQNQGQNQGQNRGPGQGQRRQNGPGQGGGQGGYRRGGGPAGQGGGDGQGAAGGYGQGGGRPSFQAGGGGIGGGRGGGRQGPGGRGAGGPRGGRGEAAGDGAGGGPSYDGHGGLYANPKE